MEIAIGIGQRRGIGVAVWHDNHPDEFVGISLVDDDTPYSYLSYLSASCFRVFNLAI